MIYTFALEIPSTLMWVGIMVHLFVVTWAPVELRYAVVLCQRGVAGTAGGRSRGWRRPHPRRQICIRS